MTTRLQWSRRGLVLVCETSKRAIPRTAWAFGLPPFAPVNTVSPCVSATLILDSETGLTIGIRVASTETLPKGYLYTLNWRTDDDTTWTQIPLGSVTAINTVISIPSTGATYRIYLSRAYSTFVEDYAEVTITVGAIAAPSAIMGLTNYWNGSQSMLQWDRSADARKVSYEIRLGSSVDSSRVLVVLPVGVTSYATVGSGTYWIAAVFQGNYSDWTPIAVTGNLLANVVATYDEVATSWGGTCSGDAVLSGGSVTLTADGTLGYYEIPSSHQIDTGTAQACAVSIDAEAYGVMRNDLVSTWPLVSARTSIVGKVFGVTDVRFQIAISQDGATWGAWQPYIQGTYYGRKFKARAVLSSSNAEAAPWLTAMVFLVDMPDRVEQVASMALPLAGANITFAKPFQIIPGVVPSIIGAVNGDWIALTNITQTGFHAQGYNGSTAKALTMGYLAKGY